MRIGDGRPANAPSQGEYKLPMLMLHSLVNQSLPNPTSRTSIFSLAWEISLAHDTSYLVTNEFCIRNCNLSVIYVVDFDQFSAPL